MDRQHQSADNTRDAPHHTQQPHGSPGVGASNASIYSRSGASPSSGGIGADRHNAILLNGNPTSRGLAVTDPSLWQSLLQKAYIAKTPPDCLCQGAQSLIPMYIARMGDTHVLKRRPNTGHLHHPDCESHGGISPAANLLYDEDAIAERADGKVVHNLSVPLSTIEHIDATADEAAAPPRPGTVTAKRSSMTLRGFLNLLWEEAGLHTWAPGMMGKRNMGRVYWGLANELADRLIAGDDAQERVFVPSGRMGEAADRDNAQEIERRFERMQTLYSDNKQGILLVIGELRSIIPTSRNFAVRLKGMPDNMPIWTPPGSIERLRKQWPNAMARFERSKWPSAAAKVPPSRPNRMIIIAGIQRSANGNLSWRYGAAMETTEDFIPVDSQHEAQIALALVAQHRRFKKPMRYDGDEATFPDFVLTDGPDEVPMEIYGFSSPEYDRRKQAKIAMYEQSKSPFWQWDLKTDKVPPPFPLIPPRPRAPGGRAA